MLDNWNERKEKIKEKFSFLHLQWNLHIMKGQGTVNMFAIRRFHYIEVLFHNNIGNSMICSDIWHKYNKWYFEIVICNFTSRYASETDLGKFWNNASGIYAKYHVQIMLLFVYTTTRKGFVVFTCRYFKLSRNTTALSQSNCRNFLYSSISGVKKILRYTKDFVI